MDILLKEPTDSEFSAFGVSFDSGGVALTNVPENSAAAKLGFRTGDLIQEINELKIKSIQNFMDYIDSHKSDKKNVFTVIRNQGRVKIKVGKNLLSVSPTGI